MSLNLHNEIWLSLITILDPALDGWELRWFCWLQGFNVAFQNLMWFGLPSINWKTPEVLQLFLKDNTFKIALVGWRKVIKARREPLITLEIQTCSAVRLALPYQGSTMCHLHEAKLPSAYMILMCKSIFQGLNFPSSFFMVSTSISLKSIRRGWMI